MKITIYLSLIFLLFVAAPIGLKAGNADKGKDSLNCLKIIGRIGNADHGGTPCKIELISFAKVIDSAILSKGNKKFNFVLKRDAFYAIRITKKGFITKLISVDTKFPSDIIDMCGFSFATDLYSEKLAKQLDQNALDFPIAIISFDPVSESFVYSKEYTVSNLKEVFKNKNPDKLAGQTF